jgi:hypothetical protein
MVAAASSCAGALAATWCVPAMQPGCDFAAPAIQAAVDAALPGDTVRVAAGNYGETVWMGKTLHLLGAQAGVDARTREGQPESRIGFALVLQSGSAGSVIDGFAFDGGPSGIQTNPGAAVALDGLRILNNRFTGFRGVAIGLGGSGDDVTIDRNHFDGSSVDPMGNLITLIGPGPFHGFWLTNNRLVGGESSSTVGLGSGEGYRHVGPSAARAPLIRGNAFLGLTAGMMPGQALDRAEISDNEFRSMKCISLIASPAHTRIEGNRFVDNGSTAIMLGMPLPSPAPPDPAEWGAHHNTITGNLVFNSGAPVPGRCELGVGIILSDGQAPGTMATNQLHGNAIVFNNGGLSYPGPDTIDARNNYWGAADGPFHPVRNPAGSGNSVNDQQAMWGGPGMILFDPWLAESPMPVPPIPPARTWCVPTMLPGCDLDAQSIQAAINAAFPGETIKVAPGDYGEALSLPKRLQLLGAQAGVDARGRVGLPESRIVSLGGQLTLRFASAGSVIDGFTFHGGFVGIQSEPMQVTTLDGLHIRNNRFTGLQDSGIALWGSGADVTIDRNYVDGSGSAYGGPLVNLGNDGAYPGFRLTNNEIVNGGPQRIGFQCSGTGNMGPSASRIPSIRGNAFSENFGGAVLLEAPMVAGPMVSGEIRDNVFTRNDHGLHAAPVATTIANNTFQDNGGVGMLLASGSRDNAILDNEVAGNGTMGGGPGLYGSLVSTIVARNGFRDNAGGGLVAEGSGTSGSVVTDNEFIGNARLGMSGDFSGAVIERNLFRANAADIDGAALSVRGSSNTVRDNEFRDNAQDGLFGGIFSSLVTGNVFEGNGGFAITLFAPANGNTVTGNRMAGNGNLGTCVDPDPARCGGGIRLSARGVASTVNDISGNTITGNRLGAMYYGVNATQVRDMRGNHWGDPGGPYHATLNPAGTGNAIVDQASDNSGPGRILFDPWLMLEPGTTALTLVEDVAADLSALLPKRSGSVDHSLQRAYDAVVESLAAQYWSGDFTLTARGHKVFDEQKKAVKELEDVVRSPDPRSGPARGAIDDLLLSQEVVARTAIDAAVAAGGNPAEIARARDALARAQLEQAAGNWDKAVDDYKKAWEHATRAY